MRVLLIPDKFKGSLTAKEVIRSIEKGIKKIDPQYEIYSVLASDGGDGFLNSVAENVSCNRILVDVVDPLGRKMKAPYLIDIKRGAAYIELAKASGLELLGNDQRNVMRASTYGSGLQIKDAIKRGVKRIYVGLGGSATNDAGTGIARALGHKFFDKTGKELEPIGENLSKIYSIEAHPEISGRISIFAVNDVDNPLFGKQGAAHVYAAQKGADQEQIKLLDEGLKHLSQLVKEQLNIDVSDSPGSGAAGGTAYGLKVFLNAEFISGIDFVLNLANVEDLFDKKSIDYIITGEGKFDNQTLHGKLIKGVVALGKKHSVPVVVICGQADVEKNELTQLGLKEVIEIRDVSKPIQYSMKHAAELIEKKIFQFLKNQNQS